MRRWKEWNWMERFAKYSKFYSINFFNFFTKCRKSAEKMTHQKKNRGHQTSKTIKSTQSYSNCHLLYYCSLYYLARARCMMWLVNFVHSKDAQKQLARTSLSIDVISHRFMLACWIPLDSVCCAFVCQSFVVHFLSLCGSKIHSGSCCL